jgi:hypothetical protein
MTEEEIAILKERLARAEDIIRKLASFGSPGAVNYLHRYKNEQIRKD